MKFLKLSIIIPVYNEAATIQHLLSRVMAVELPKIIVKEIVIVNDCSTDETIAKIGNFVE